MAWSHRHPTGPLGVAGLALMAGLVAMAAPLRASAPDLFGFGMRPSGMGATGAAHADGYDAVYANPAGLTQGEHKRLTVGYLFGHFDLYLSANVREVRAPRADNAYGLVIGAAIPLGFRGWLRNKMWIGMGFYLPTGVVTRARVPLPGQPFFPVLESRTQVVGIMVSGAIEPYPGVRIGAGVLALAALTGTVWINADPGGHIGSTVEQQLVVDYAPIFGVMVTPSRVKWLTAGLVYRGESIARFDVKLKNNLQGELPVGLPEMNIAGVAQYDPQQLAAEVAFRPRRGLTVAVQLAWKNWARYPLPTENVTVTSPQQPRPGFKDTVVPRVGLEQVWWLGRWSVSARGGYFFEPTPLPPQDGILNLIDNHRHALSAGLGTAYRKGALTPFSVDLGFQLHLLQPREHRKDLAALAAAGADPLLLQYGRSPYRSWGQLYVLGVQVGVEF